VRMRWCREMLSLAVITLAASKLAVPVSHRYPHFMYRQIRAKERL
jgi:hypothetical protein